MYLAMTYQEIVLKVGINIGTSTPVIETYRGNFFSKNITPHFLSTSPTASITEQFHGIKQIIEYINVIRGARQSW